MSVMEDFLHQLQLTAPGVASPEVKLPVKIESSFFLSAERRQTAKKSKFPYSPQIPIPEEKHVINQRLGQKHKSL